MAIQQYHSSSAEATRQIGKSIARTLSGGEVLALFGELGAGKTTFVQGLARGLGIKTPLVSPSYILVRRYNNLVHADLYRLETRDEILALGLHELFAADPIVVIEWAEKIEDLLPRHFIKIAFRIVGSSAREITIEHL